MPSINNHFQISDNFKTVLKMQAVTRRHLVLLVPSVMRASAPDLDVKKSTKIVMVLMM